MKKHLKIWLKAFLLLWLCHGNLLLSPTAVRAANTHPTDVCELPAPDSAWIIGATGNSITVGWTPVPGAYQYKVVVANLDGGGAPPPQYIMAPTVQTTFSSLSPGKYKFKISATGCLGGDFGLSRDVIGGTAIIIDDVVYENCAPTILIAPLQSTTPVCIPYGDLPEENVELIAFEVKGKYNPPPYGGTDLPEYNWSCEFNMMMPCPGSFAYSTAELSNATVEIFGGPGSPLVPMIKFHPQYANGNVDLFTVSGVRWWSTPPNPGQNNGCSDSYTASFIIQLVSGPNTTFVSMKRSTTNKDGDFSSFCMGRLVDPNGFSCLVGEPTSRPGNPGSDPTEAVPFEWEDQDAVQLRVAPNPFGSTLDVGYRLDQDAPIDLALYNPMGRRVKTLEQTQLTLAGAYRTAIDAADLPTGLYYLVLQTDQERRIVPVVKNE